MRLAGLLVFAMGRRAIRVPKPAGHGRLHYTLVARDEAGNRSKVTSGRL